MGSWSTSAPAVGTSGWVNPASASWTMNHFKVSLVMHSARGSGSTYYIRIVATFSPGSMQDYYPPDTMFMFADADYGSFSPPGGGGSVTRYYTGSGTGGTLAGVSSKSGSYKGHSANATVTIPAKFTYAVNYNGNGATGGSTASQTKTSGTALTLRNNGFTRPGYIFLGWNTAANGSGTSYAAGGTYTADAAVTLYAQWKKANIPIYYNNGGTIRQAEKAYYSRPTGTGRGDDGGAVTAVKVYINNDGTIVALD